MRKPILILMTFGVLLLLGAAAGAAPAPDENGDVWFVEKPAALADAAAELSPARRAEMEAEIARLRALVESQGLPFTVGETSRMRMTPEQRLATLMPRIPDPDPSVPLDPGLATILPRDGETLDWRSNGGNFVTPPRNQGDCGSCWIFGAMGAMESAFLIAIGEGNIPYWDLSEQYVLSCASYGWGCDGGQTATAINFGHSTGILEECCMPYTGNHFQPCDDHCMDTEGRRYFFGQAYYVCYSPNITAIKTALNNYGPLATSMTTYDTFDAYDGGVYVASGTQTGGHAVLIIGYNDTAGYFIGKNSWGLDWGIGGYFYIDYYSGTNFGSYTTRTSFDATGMGPYAAYQVEDLTPKTGDPIWFYDRSVPVSGDIVTWEWDFNGDGTIDATGPGSKQFTFTTSGHKTPTLRVVDADGQDDVENLIDLLNVTFDGPIWVVDAAIGTPGG